MDNSYDEYIDRRNYWSNIIAKEINKMDNHIVFISCFAIILPFFVDNFTGNSSNHFLMCIIWAILFLSIALRLLSFFTSSKNAEEKIKIIDKNFKNYFDNMSIYKHDSLDDTIFQPLTRWINTISLAMFIVGISLTFIYLILAICKI